jgi:endonuclease III
MAEAVASRIRQTAAVAIELGDLGTAIRRSVPEARRALRRFPGIGGPGADMVLLFSRAHAIPAVDSNGLRVLQRLGLAGSIESYSAAYRAATLVMASEIGTDSNRLIEAYLLLRVHGRELCRRSSPDCTACPVRAVCAYGSRRD